MFANDLFIPVAILLATAVLLISNRLRSDVIALLIIISLMLSGVLTVDEALSGFSNPAVIIIASMFLVSEAILHTGIAHKVGETVLRRGGSSETRLLLLIMAASALIGSLMSSSATVAIFIPIVLAVAEKSGINHKRLLMPLAIASLISGMMTLVATTPNIVINNALTGRGLEGLSFFSFTPFGVTVLILAMTFMGLVGRSLLAPDTTTQHRKKEFSIEDLLRRYQLNQTSALLHVTPGSDLIDRSVAGVDLRTEYDLNLIALQTTTDQGRVIVPAEGETMFRVADVLVLLGAPDQIERFTQRYQLTRLDISSSPGSRKEIIRVIGAGEVMLTPDSDLIGKSIRELGFYTKFRCQILAIRRKGGTLTDTFADEPLQFGDVLLICGAWNNIIRLRQYRDQYILLTLPDDFHDVIPGRSRAPVAVALLAAMIGLIAFNIVPTVTAVLTTIAGLILTGCVRIEACYKAIDWQSVILIAGILPLALALQKTGASGLLSDFLGAHFANAHPLFFLAALFLATVLLGLVLSNTPTAALMAPIAIDLGLNLGISPQACAMTIAIASSSAFISPMGSPVNLIVQEPGGYKFMDYARVGTPLLGLSLMATMALIWLFYLR
ncbi:MAG: SLC13 family permease [Desulfobulbus sp.]|jgi:di/tricarboxylate transporter